MGEWSVHVPGSIKGRSRNLTRPQPRRDWPTSTPSAMVHPVVVMLGESVPQHLDVDRRLPLR